MCAYKINAWFLLLLFVIVTPVISIFFLLYFWAKRFEIEWWRLQAVRYSAILFALALHFSLTKIVAFVVCKQRSGSMLTLFRFKMHLWGGVVRLELAVATTTMMVVVVEAVAAMDFLLIIFCKSSAVFCIVFYWHSVRGQVHCYR